MINPLLAPQTLARIEFTPSTPSLVDCEAGVALAQCVAGEILVVDLSHRFLGGREATQTSCPNHLKMTSELPTAIIFKFLHIYAAITGCALRRPQFTIRDVGRHVILTAAHIDAMTDPCWMKWPVY